MLNQQFSYRREPKHCHPIPRPTAAFAACYGALTPSDLCVGSVHRHRYCIVTTKLFCLNLPSSIREELKLKAMQQCFWVDRGP